RASGASSALAGGRWSLVADLAAAGGPLSPTERLLAQARMLLGRYGIVSREAVAAEGLPGGFGPLYRVFKQMEEQGQVRRGHFVEGLSGAQFASPGAVDQLRGARLEEPPLDGFGADALTILAASDPANPYGALLPWPATAGAQAPRRAAGCTLLLVAGRPVLYLGVGGRQLTSFAGDDDDQGALDLALDALHRLPRGGRGRFAIRQIDGQPPLATPLGPRLLAAGFEPDGDTLIPSRDPARYQARTTRRDGIAGAGPES
ncbi:MAG: DEAD/DEAH box helicase, partial [Chromatiaceae bacterium]